MSNETDELKAYAKVIGTHIIEDNMGHCEKCGRWTDLRMGHCFTCVFDECPLESCNHKKIVFNVKKERVFKDLVYTGLDGTRYCNRMEGMCDEAVIVVSKQREDEQ